MALEMTPIGTVHNARREPLDDGWDEVSSTIRLDLTTLGADATLGLRAFSHVEVVFAFDRIDPATVTTDARHPRGNPDWPRVGILAQRASGRPNRIGVTVCELMSVRPGGEIEVRGLDAIDGTPVLDIKPYMREFVPRGDVTQPEWSAELMRNYWTAPTTPAALAEADSWLAEVRRSPADAGSLDLIVARPEVDERTVLDTAQLDLAVGLVGDNWSARGSRSMPNGEADPEAQLNIMNSRCARLVAGGEERMPLAGDQLYVDLDLSPANLPPGTRLQVGDAVVEITAKPHTGCAKFTRRFGLATHRWINGNDGKAERLRGVCAKVVVPGTIRRGDTITKVNP